MDRKELATLYQVALASGLADRREALVCVFDSRIRAEMTRQGPLPVADQLRFDLDFLNEHVDSGDRSLLNIWLECAITMTHGRREQSLLKDMLLALIPPGFSVVLQGLGSAAQHEIRILLQSLRLDVDGVIGEVARGRHVRLLGRLGRVDAEAVCARFSTLGALVIIENRRGAARHP